MAEQRRSISQECGAISPEEKDVTDGNTTTTMKSNINPNTDLGAQASGVTRTSTASASLLPTVIADALNSRLMRSSQFSHQHNTPGSIPLATAPCHPVSEKTIEMGYNMNHVDTGGTSRSGCSESLDQSQIAQDALAPTSASTNQDKSPMTNPNDSNSAPPKAQTLLFGNFDPDAYGKPERLRQGFQERLVRQGPVTSPTTPRYVSSPNNTTVPRPLNGRIESFDLASVETDTTTLADPCSKAPLGNMLLATQPRSNMKQDQSITTKNRGSESTVRKKGKRARRGMEENKRPCDVVATSKPTTSEQEAQVRETQVEKLARLQKQEMSKLGIKIRHQSAEPTTSPQALSLARQASINLRTTEIPPETPQATPVVLSQTMAAQSNGMKNGTTSMNGSGVQTRALDPSREHNNGSVRSPNMSTRGRRGGRIQNPARSRWATTAEIKPPPASEKSIDSNAFGSELPSDAETASGDSVAPMDNGRLLRKNRPAGQDAPLADWSGNWMPPPIDWDQRPRFNNNSAQFVGEFGHWNETTAAQSVNVDTGAPFTRLSRDLVQDPDLHPDGLSLVDRTMTVDVDNANQYGYSEDAKDTIRRDARLIAPDIFTNDWGKLDMKDPDNLKYHNECCNDLVRNYNANIARERQEEMSMQRAQKLARRQAGSYIPSPNPHTPRINIYLRPAVRSDVPQMQGIYNQYVENSVHTSEIQPITYLNMLDRWIASTTDQLPFVVAVSKSAKINRQIGNAVEKIVGWASATDWVTRYSVERFTVELDMYVHLDHRHQGVGKCLMDKLIDSTDRGHIARKGYPFTCAPEERHAYSAGGARNLMKLRLMVRSFDKPRNNDENDLPWIKKWLEDEWNFEQQGFFPKGGAKFKRHVNFTCFVRSTSYSPKEFMMPEDSP